jgi:hypothetical protein
MRWQIFRCGCQQRPALGGWGGRTRTSEWQNQNPAISRVSSITILKNQGNSTDYASIGSSAPQYAAGQETDIAAKTDTMASDTEKLGKLEQTGDFASRAWRPSRACSSDDTGAPSIGWLREAK